MTKTSSNDRLQTGLNGFETMQNHATEMMPKEMASAVNLFVHPAAGMAAASALGFGLASQAFGMWLGALSGMGEASHRMLQSLDDKPPQEAGSPRSAPALRLVSMAAADGATKGRGRPQGIEKPAVPDDLKAIAGIGPKLEAVLNGYGVWTYGQIADWTDAEIAWMDDTLGFRGRIRRDDWAGQAASLRDGQRVK